MTLSRGAPNWMEDACGRFVTVCAPAPGVGGQNVFTVFSVGLMSSTYSVLLCSAIRGLSVEFISLIGFRQVGRSLVMTPEQQQQQSRIRALSSCRPVELDARQRAERIRGNGRRGGGRRR